MVPPGAEKQCLEEGEDGSACWKGSVLSLGAAYKMYCSCKNLQGATLQFSCLLYTLIMFQSQVYTDY